MPCGLITLIFILGPGNNHFSILKYQSSCPNRIPESHDQCCEPLWVILSITALITKIFQVKLTSQVCCWYQVLNSRLCVLWLLDTRGYFCYLLVLLIIWHILASGYHIRRLYVPLLRCSKHRSLLKRMGLLELRIVHLRRSIDAGLWFQILRNIKLRLLNCWFLFYFLLLVLLLLCFMRQSLTHFIF